VSAGGALSPEFTRLQSSSHEIAGDQLSDDDRTLADAIREYNQSLRLFEVARAIDSNGAVASSRVHRKLAAIDIDKRDYVSADLQIAAADKLLDGSDEAQSERAGLDDAIAAEAASQHNYSAAQRQLEGAVALDRQMLDKALQSQSPILSLRASLAAHLQHLGDVLRHEGNDTASAAYDEAEILAGEILESYSNQLGPRFMLDLIRHGRWLVIGHGQATTQVKQIAAR